MKTSIIAISAAALGFAVSANALEDLSVSATFGYESEYVFRGDKLDQQAFQPAVDIEYGNFYAGIWGSYGISTRDRGGRETDFFGGYAFALDEMVSLDFGATYYYYSGDDASTFEAYFGAAFDVMLQPAGYVYYDFDTEVWTFELSGGYSFEVADQTSLDLSVHLGAQYDSDVTKDWAYYGGVALDLTYELSDNASFSIGPRVSSKKYDNVSAFQNFWWGAAFTAGF